MSKPIDVSGFKPDFLEYYSNPAQLFIPFEENKTSRGLRQFKKKDLTMTQEIWVTITTAKELAEERQAKRDAAEGKFAEEKLKSALTKLRKN